MWHDLLAAVALLLVIEGILPFLSPRSARQLMQQVSQSDDRALRSAGLISMVIGVILLYLVR